MPHALVGHDRSVGHFPSLYMRPDATYAPGRIGPATKNYFHIRKRLYATGTYVWVPHAFSHPNVAKVFLAINLPASQPITHMDAIIVARFVCDHVNKCFLQGCEEPNLYFTHETCWTFASVCLILPLSNFVLCPFCCVESTCWLWTNDFA